MATAAPSELSPAGAFVPLPFRVAARRQDTVDTWTLTLAPEEDGFAVAPGQFVMVHAWGIGEVPISVSGPPEHVGEPIVLTVRAVGAVTQAICASEPGALLGLRGPCGNNWPIAEAAGGDVLVVAGGIGLAPLRPVVLHALANRSDYGAAAVLYGARTPGDLLYVDELEQWRTTLAVDVTVDAADTSWKGKVGVVPQLIGERGVPPGRRDCVRLWPRGDDPLHRRGAAGARRARRADHPLARARHALRRRPLRPLPARADARLPGWAGLLAGGSRSATGGEGAMSTNGKPKLAVWKFASCDGCQLTILDLEDELLALTEAVEIADFREATSAVAEGPYDVSLVEGSITTAHDAERIQEIRSASKALITIGACATAGGIQALRNFADVEEFTRIVYASPEYISTLATSTPISAHVPVDFELRGCPIDKRQLLELVSAFLIGRRPQIPATSVCIECKLRGNDVRDGGARDAVPRAGHAGGLRRPLSVVQPRLLRLLRPDGEPEHRCSRAAPASARPRRSRRRAALLHLQRGRRALQGGRRTWLSAARS